MIKETICIAAGKGGVGKSTIAVNLALALRDLGLKVGLMDCDLYGPSLQELLPVPIPAAIPSETCGIKTLSMAYFLSEKSAVIRAPMAQKWLTRFFTEVDWGNLDILLLDFPPGTGDIHLTIAQLAQLSGALLVTTSQKLSLIDVQRCADAFERMKVPLLGVIENMTSLFGEGGGEELSKRLQIPLLATIPFDQKLQQGPGKTQYFLSLARLLEKPKERMSVSFDLLDRRTLVIQKDGEKREMNVASLQRFCPCAACKANGAHVQEDVEALGLKMVGRYGIQIQFSSGCSLGIYTSEVGL